MTASTTPAAVRFRVEMDTVVDGMLELLEPDGLGFDLSAMTHEQQALLGAGMIAATVPGVDGVRVLNASGPGGGHPVIEYTGTEEGLTALLRTAFDMDESEIELPFEPVGEVMPA